jgi:DNA-binding phage protein
MKDAKMAVTKSFKELVQRRVAVDAAFAENLLREGIDTMLTGDIEAGKAILRDYIKATVGFQKLGEATDTPAKSLIRMFSPRGNPQARNLFGVIGYLQREAGVEFHVMPESR